MIKKNDRTRTYYDEIWAWMFSKKMENMVTVILCMKCKLCVDDMKSWMDTTGVVGLVVMGSFLRVWEVGSRIWIHQWEALEK